MNTALFDCFSGISGDMTLGALLDTGLPHDLLLGLPDALKLRDTSLRISSVEKNGITATRVIVDIPHEHVHRHLRDVVEIIENGDISERARALAITIFTYLAEAEARVHGIAVEKVHFHEVGALDAIVDITGAAVLWDALGIEKAWAGPVAVGGGRVKIAHGLYPVPAPATLGLLQGFTLEQGPVQKELVTPTGAAILKACVANPAETPPPFRLTSVGYGAGSMTHEHVPNVLRVQLGELYTQVGTDELQLLECTIDDMNPELYGHVLEKLFAAGVADAWLTPVIMKKGRPGVQVSLLCSRAQESAAHKVLFAETTTIGVRSLPVSRMKLMREPVVLETAIGPLQFKKIILPDGQTRHSPEFESCKTLAGEKGVSLRKVYELATARAVQEDNREGNE